jgi:hypothetical protein
MLRYPPSPQRGPAGRLRSGTPNYSDRRCAHPQGTNNAGCLSYSLLHSEQDAAFGPEAFEVVVFALFGREEVDDDTAEVNEHPAAGSLIIDAFEHGTALDEFIGDIADGFGQCAQLTVAGAVGNDEIIGKGRLFGNIQQ